jgi:sugar lactone lactonase YvrE
VRRYVLPGERVFPEGITEGPGTSFFVGSLGDGTIFRGDAATGAVEVFLPPNGDGRQAIAGLDIDGYGRLIACDFDGRQVFGYDLASRQLVARHRLPAAGSMPNDVVVAGDTAYVTDSADPVIWRLPAGPAGIGEPEVAIDLAGFGVADPAYLNGIVAHPDGSLLLAASQGEGGVLWRVDLAEATASPVDLGGYEFNADGMLIDGEVLYGVLNRGETAEDVVFMISAARLVPDWRSGVILSELTYPEWDFPTTIAKVGGQLLVVCSQINRRDTAVPPTLPFEVIGTGFPALP